MRPRRLALLRRRFFQTLSILLLASVTFIFARGALRMYERYTDARGAEAIAQAELENLKERKADLSDRTAMLSSDRGMEEALRERYGVVREGERVIEIVETQEEMPTTTPAGGGLLRWFKQLF